MKGWGSSFDMLAGETRRMLYMKGVTFGLWDYGVG